MLIRGGGDWESLQSPPRPLRSSGLVATGSPPLSGRLVKDLAPRKEGPLVSSLLTPGEKKVWVGGVRSVYLQAQMASERKGSHKELGTHKQTSPNSNHPPPPPWGTGGPWQGVGCYWLPFGQPTTTCLASHALPRAAHHASKMRRPRPKGRAQATRMSSFAGVGTPGPASSASPQGALVAQHTCSSDT